MHESGKLATWAQTHLDIVKDNETEIVFSTWGGTDSTALAGGTHLIEQPDTTANRGYAVLILQHNPAI